MISPLLFSTDLVVRMSDLLRRVSFPVVVSAGVPSPMSVPIREVLSERVRPEELKTVRLLVVEILAIEDL
jgi:hypothetical protein